MRYSNLPRSGLAENNLITSTSKWIDYLKRDMDLVRKILLLLEDSSQCRIPHIEGYTQKEVGHHVYLMMQAGLVEGRDVTSYGDEYPVAIPTGLTWEGHDFLAACRNENVWHIAKEKLKSIGGDVPLAIVKTVLTTIITKQLVE